MAMRSPRIPGAALIVLMGALVLSASPAPSSAAPQPAPVSLAVIVPVSIEGGATGIYTATELETATIPGGYLYQLVKAVDGTSATLAIDPMLLVSVRLLGNEAPPSALLWLQSLAALRNETFALSYADSDITLALQAGSKRVLAPTSFTFAINPDRFAENASDGQPTASPSEETDPTRPPLLPTTESLTSWNYTFPRIAWPRENTTTSADIDSIVAGGYTTTILNSGNVDRTSPAISAVSQATGEVLVTDDAASSELENSLSAQTQPVWSASLERLAARLSVVAGGSSQPATMVISTGRGTIAHVDRLAASLAKIDSKSGVTVVGLSAVAGGPQTQGRLIERPNPASTIKRVTSMLEAESADEAFSGVAQNPDAIIGERRTHLLAALSPSWDRYDGGWGPQVTNFLAESAQLRHSVRVIESSEIIFAADRGLLPVTVGNELAQAVNVVITVRPRTPLLSIEDTQYELTIEPLSQRRALIPAQSRSNGIVELVVSLRTNDGLSFGSPTTVSARVQAGWETPVTLSAAVVVFLVFGFGLVRTIRRRRSAQKATASE